MTVSRPEFVAMLACPATGKLVFSRKQARRFLRWHRSTWCAQCRSGRFDWREYACDEHWHIGHWRLP